MSGLRAFVVKTELDQVLQGFSVRHSLKGYLNLEGDYEAYDPTIVPSELFQRFDSTDDAFLLPANHILPTHISEETIEVIQPRFAGWIQVNPGRLIEKDGQRILTMTTLQAEDTKGLSFKPATWLRRYKKSLSSFITFGVDGVNIVYGGRYTYNDIGYSQEALRLHQEGVHWKQFGVEGVEYFPISPTVLN